MSPNSKTHKLGQAIQLRFRLTQHSRDEALMRSLIGYFDCGNVYIYKEGVDFIITGFSDQTDKIIPFFIKYPILGVKSKDFDDYHLVAQLMKEKKHLTQEGLKKILEIKSGMNQKRGI